MNSPFSCYFLDLGITFKDVLRFDHLSINKKQQNVNSPNRIIAITNSILIARRRVDISGTFSFPHKYIFSI